MPYYISHGFIVFDLHSPIKNYIDYINKGSKYWKIIFENNDIVVFGVDQFLDLKNLEHIREFDDIIFTINALNIPLEDVFRRPYDKTEYDLPFFATNAFFTDETYFTYVVYENNAYHSVTNYVTHDKSKADFFNYYKSKKRENAIKIRNPINRAPSQPAPQRKRTPQKICNNDVEPVTQEDISSYNPNDLVYIPVENGKFVCYEVDSILQHIEQKIQENLPIKEPTTGVKIEDDTIQEIVSKKKKTDSSYKLPSKAIPKLIKEGYSLFFEPSAKLYDRRNQVFEMDKIVVVKNSERHEFGLIPADIEAEETGSQNLSSDVLKVNLMKLWDEGRLIVKDNNRNMLLSPRIHLFKNTNYWKGISAAESVVKKFIKMAKEVEDYL